jgi:small-conductance mechanosensitive channel/CRP-like cAMP-binding protein
MQDFLATAFAHAWPAGTGYVVLMVAGLATLLWVRLPANDQPQVHNTVVFWALAFAAQLAAGAGHALGLASGPDYLREAAVLAGGLAVIRLWGFVLFRVVMPLLRTTNTHFLEDIVITIGYLAWVFVRLRYAGLDLGSLVATSAVITAILAFSMQDTLGNVLGGIALQADRSIEVGDWIKLDDLSGRVVDIGWRSTMVETRNWETVAIPNAVLMKNRFSIIGRRRNQPTQWRRWVHFHTGYEHPPSRIVELAERAVAEAEINNVARLPLPTCVLLELDAGRCHYALRYFLTNIEDDDPTDSRVRIHVLAALQRAGIRIATPEWNVHTVTEDERYRAAVRGRETERRLVALRGVELFATLTDEELNQAAEGLTFAPFAAGDTITRQGAEAHWLYLLVSGEAEVFVEHERGERSPIGALTAPAFFGEMSLMTGAPRAATVVARTDCECYRLDRATFGRIIKARPELAEQITPVLEERRRSVMTALAARGVTTAADAGAGDLLTRVRRFFGL